MSRVSTTQNVSNVDSFEDLQRYVSIQLDAILSEINGRLSFGQNIRTKILNVAFTSSGVAVEAIHGLGLVPSGYILVGSDLPVQIYDGGVNTASSVFLKSSGATYPINTKVLIF